MTEPTPRPDIAPDARPRLRRGARLQHSEPHGGMVLLAPERVFKADAIATAILQRCDGKATLAEIADDLATLYNAPRERVLADVSALLRGLADKQLVDI
jgi:pyrroloquinoline quinone biosynthesis protein D